MFWNKNITIKENKNIVIIGGGISGLVCGIYSLLEGNNVVIIEKKNQLGGKLNYSDYSNNFPKIILGKEELTILLDEMDIDSSIIEVFSEPLITYIDEEEEIKIPNSLNGLEEYLYSNSIDDKKVIKEFLSIIYQLKDYYKPYKKPYDLLKLLELNKEKKNIEVLRKIEKKYNEITINDFFNKFNSKKIKKLFVNVMPKHQSVSDLFVMLACYYNNNLCYFKNELLTKIIEKYKELGGKYLLNNEAKEFSFGKLNKVEKVVLDNGKTVEGDYFISAVDPYVCYNNLLKNKYNNRSYYLRYEDYMNNNVDNRLIICFQSNKEFAYNNIILKVEDLKLNTTSVEEINIVFKNKYIYCVIPQTYNDYDYLKIIKNKKFLYEENEKNIVALLKKEIERRYSGCILKHVETIDPTKVEEKMFSYRGALKGFVSTPKGQYINVLGIVPNLKNVFLSSSWLQYDGGILNAIISGKFSAMRVEREKKNE